MFGFEKVHLETLGVNTDTIMVETENDGVLSKNYSFGTRTEKNGENGVKCDLMSIGIIVFMLLVGMAPF